MSGNFPAARSATTCARHRRLGVNTVVALIASTRMTTVRVTRLVSGACLCGIVGKPLELFIGWSVRYFNQKLGPSLLWPIRYVSRSHGITHLDCGDYFPWPQILSGWQLLHVIPVH